MKIICKLLICGTIIAFILYDFVGCASYFYPEREPYAGEPITPDQIAEISESLAESKALAESEKNASNTEEITEPFTPDTDDQGNVMVYWTENGLVWHLDLKCPSFSRSIKIESGTEDAAINAGKERLCKKCNELLVDEENTPKE